MMEYRNDSVRRQDRLLGEERARELLRGGEYGFLAMASDEGAYGIPVNYVAEGDTIYIHCAPEGRKLRAIAADARVSFCVVGVTRPVPEKFTTAYESIVVSGRARATSGVMLWNFWSESMLRIMRPSVRNISTSRSTARQSSPSMPNGGRARQNVCDRAV